MAEHGWVYQDNGIVVYRASSLGSCIRSLVAARLGESAAGPNAGLRAAMDASSGLEEECIRRFGIEMASSDVIWQQKEVELPVELACTECGYFKVPEDPQPCSCGGKWEATTIVRGHIDGMSMYDDTILEVKALGEGNWAKWVDGKNVHESLANLGTLGDKYRIQAALYGHATERKVRFVIGQKKKVMAAGTIIDNDDPPTIATRDLWVIEELDVSPPIDPNDLYSLSDLQARIAFIEDHASRDELPPCDSDCREGDPYSEAHFFESHKPVDDIAAAKMARFQDIKDILGSADKGTGLLGEKEDLSEWMKENLGVGKFTAGVYSARVEHVKPTERIDTRRLKKERPDIAEEYTTFGKPTIRLSVTGGEKRDEE